MAATTRSRGVSVGEGLRVPHSVSLKVLRLSRPSLHYQYPLPDTPASSALHINPKASLAYAAAEPDDNFIISPVLTLPESFRSAYVGEEFACTLCANNEVLAADSAGKKVSAVRITAEMQLPLGDTVTLDLEGSGSSENRAGKDDGSELSPGASLQKIVRLSLSEPGQHVLAVLVTYTETSLGAEGSAATGGRVRTFRKLYQFIAQPLINVKTKSGDMAATKYGGARYALEAQLQNVGDRTVCLEAVSVNPTPAFSWRSLNWDAFPSHVNSNGESTHAPILHPSDTLQLAFMLEQKHSASVDKSEDGVTLGQLNIQWRSAMGDRGSLKTTWLTRR